MGQDYRPRGARLEEQIPLLRRLWSEASVDFDGRFDTVRQAGIDPRPISPIPIWIGAGRIPSDTILDRMGRLADGWFALCGPDDYPKLAAGVARGPKPPGGTRARSVPRPRWWRSAPRVTAGGTSWNDGDHSASPTSTSERLGPN